MNKIVLYQILVFFFLIISIHFTNGCLKKKLQLHAITIVGDELDVFSDVNVYKECDVESDLLLLNFYNPELMTYHYFEDINLAISIAKNKFLKDDDISQKLFTIFTVAKDHLRTYFLGETFDIEIYRKILVCCIEYSIRLGNTKYIEKMLNIDCKRILGLNADKLNFHYAAESYTEKSIFEFVIIA